MSRTLILLSLSALASAERGILDLDNTTLDRVVGGASAVFVRVDQEYPYGDADGDDNHHQSITLRHPGGQNHPIILVRRM